MCRICLSLQASGRFLVGYDAFASLDTTNRRWFMKLYELKASGMLVAVESFCIKRQHIVPTTYAEEQLWPAPGRGGGGGAGRRGRGRRGGRGGRRGRGRGAAPAIDDGGFGEGGGSDEGEAGDSSGADAMPAPAIDGGGEASEGDGSEVAADGGMPDIFVDDAEVGRVWVYN